MSSDKSLNKSFETPETKAPSETPPASAVVSRRDFLHGVSSAVAIASVPSAANVFPRLGKSASPSARLAHPYLRKAFDEHQWRTVQVLTNLIIPADESSGGATDAGVPECIDDWIDFYANQDGDDRLRTMVFGGLAWLDRESQQLFSTDFVNASIDQQKQILDRIAWPAHATKDDRPWVEFFNLIRDLTVAAFYSSKMGVTDLPYLGNTFNPNWTGCDPAVWSTIVQRIQKGYKGVVSAGPPSRRT